MYTQRCTHTNMRVHKHAHTQTRTYINMYTQRGEDQPLQTVLSSPMWHPRRKPYSIQLYVRCLSVCPLRHDGKIERVLSSGAPRITASHTSCGSPWSCKCWAHLWSCLPRSLPCGLSGLDMLEGLGWDLRRWEPKSPAGPWTPLAGP